jgi:hypothetical protein
MEREMKKIIAIAACLQLLALTGLMMASSAHAADQKAKIVVAKITDYALERDGCFYTR